MLGLTAHAQALAHGRARAKIRDACKPRRALTANGCAPRRMSLGASAAYAARQIGQSERVERYAFLIGASRHGLMQGSRHAEAQLPAVNRLQVRRRNARPFPLERGDRFADDAPQTTNGLGLR